MLRKLLRLSFVPSALLAVGVIRLLARFGILIRFGEFWSERIGHLIGNTECYLCQKDAGLQGKAFDIWFYRSVPANKQIAKMYERVMWVDRTGFSRIVALCNSAFRGWENFVVSAYQLDRDIYNLYGKQPPHIKLTAREELKGWETMRKWGIPEGSKWVCLIIRDSAYLPEKHYHDYRDSTAKNYVLAALELAERGYYVFRMGAKVKDRFPIKHPRIFDYATNGMFSDFMSVYLGAKCEFCISNGTGFDAIPVVFRKPVCFVNYVPLEYLNTWVKSVAIWKHHYKDGKRMTPKEIYESGAGHFMRTEQFTEAGIFLRENSEEEIMDAVLEMVDFVTADFPAELSDCQHQFWKEFPRSLSMFNQRPLHGEIRMRIGRKFLESYESSSLDRAA